MEEEEDNSEIPRELLPNLAKMKACIERLSATKDVVLSLAPAKEPYYRKLKNSRKSL